MPTKAGTFPERLAAAGCEVTIPALDDGDFTSLTITRQLAVVRREVDPTRERQRAEA